MEQAAGEGHKDAVARLQQELLDVKHLLYEAKRQVVSLTPWQLLHAFVIAP